MNCPTCQTPVTQPGAAFCDNCGSPLSSAPPAPAGQAAAPAPGGTACPGCGTAIMPGEAFCGNCGMALPAAGAAPVAPAPPPQVNMPPAQQPGIGAIICAQCGTSLQPGSAFCDNCGAAVSSANQPAQQPQQPQWSPPPPQHQQPQQPQWSPGPAITPRLVVQATQAPISLPSGKSELLIGREDPVSNHYPDVDLGPHGGEEGGVSRSHAKFHIQGNQCFLEDLDSVNYTVVDKQKLTPRTRHLLNNGAEIRFGKVVVMFYTQ